jgi:hypothetical protein
MISLQCSGSENSTKHIEIHRHSKGLQNSYRCGQTQSNMHFLGKGDKKKVLEPHHMKKLPQQHEPKVKVQPIQLSKIKSPTGNMICIFWSFRPGGERCRLVSWGGRLTINVVTKQDS